MFLFSQTCKQTAEAESSSDEFGFFFLKIDFLSVVWVSSKFPAEGIKIHACGDICFSRANNK